MAVYTNLPTLAIDFMKPSKASFDVKGGSMEGPRNGLGESIAIDMTGGGIITATYSDCFAQRPEEHEYTNWLGARLNNRSRFIVVPTLTDWTGPFPVNSRNIPTSIVRSIPHSDGALFSDSSGYEQPTVWGQITEAAAQNAGVVNVQVFGAVRPLRWSDWFSIYHPTKGWRAYRYWEVRNIDNSDADAPIYTLAIMPTLREAVTDERVEFARPRCVMRLAADSTIPWDIEGFWQSQPTLKFVEAW